LARANGENFIKAQQNLIESLQQEQRYLEAGIATGVLFEALPQQHQLARIASLLLLRENALELANYYALQAVKLNPRDTNYKLTLAEILYKSKRVQEAINMLDEVIAQDPNNLKAKQIKRGISQ
jgi:predicted Zn-dependent protease